MVETSVYFHIWSFVLFVKIRIRAANINKTMEWVLMTESR